MRQFGELLLSARKKRRISIDRASRDLVIKKGHLQALEEENWRDLPEPAYVKAYIKSYAQYLKLDPEFVLAVYRREFDERMFPAKPVPKRERRFFVTPGKFLNAIFALAIVTFILYIATQYASIFSAPKLDISSPKNDEVTSVPAIKIIGQTEKDATVSVNGDFAPVDENGNFSYEYVLSDGKNDIELIASFRLSPKTKTTRTVRLIR